MNDKMTKLTHDDFQQKLAEKLKYGELPYQNASIFTVILDLVQGNGPEEVFRVFYEVIKWQEQFKNK
jgi:hypothetical protein